MYEEEKNVITNMGLMEAYNQFILLMNDTKNTEMYDKVRYGVGIICDIYTLVEQNYSVKQRKGYVILRNEDNKKCKYTISDLNTEKERRLIIIKKHLMDNVQHLDIITPRGADMVRGMA